MKKIRFVILALAICAAFLYFSDKHMFLSQLKRDHIYDEKTQTITISDYVIAERDFPLLETLEIKGALIYGKAVNTDILNHLPSNLGSLSLIDSSIDAKSLPFLSRYQDLTYLRINSKTLAEEELASFPDLPKLQFLRLEFPGVDLSTINLSDKIPADCDLSSH